MDRIGLDVRHCSNATTTAKPSGLKTSKPENTVRSQQKNLHSSEALKSQLWKHETTSICLFQSSHWRCSWPYIYKKALLTKVLWNFAIYVFIADGYVLVVAVGFFICCFGFLHTNTRAHTHTPSSHLKLLYTLIATQISILRCKDFKKNTENLTKCHILLNARKKTWFLENVTVIGLKRLVLVSSWSQLPVVIEILERTTAEILLFVSLVTTTIFFMTLLTRWSSRFSKCQIL